MVGWKAWDQSLLEHQNRIQCTFFMSSPKFSHLIFSASWTNPRWLTLSEKRHQTWRNFKLDTTPSFLWLLGTFVFFLRQKPGQVSGHKKFMDGPHFKAKVSTCFSFSSKYIGPNGHQNSKILIRCACPKTSNSFSTCLRMFETVFVFLIIRMVSNRKCFVFNFSQLQKKKVYQEKQFCFCQKLIKRPLKSQSDQKLFGELFVRSDQKCYLGIGVGCPQTAAKDHSVICKAKPCFAATRLRTRWCLICISCSVIFSYQFDLLWKLFETQAPSQNLSSSRLCRDETIGHWSDLFPVGFPIWDEENVTYLSHMRLETESSLQIIESQTWLSSTLQVSCVEKALKWQHIYLLLKMKG